MEKIYLDDLRTPVDKTWIVVRNYEEFVEKVEEIGLDNIELITLDHDLGPGAMEEWHNTVNSFGINYDNIPEKTGFDVAKWLVEQWMNGMPIVEVVVHSANPVGSANIMGYINQYLHINRLPETCIRTRFDFTAKYSFL